MRVADEAGREVARFAPSATGLAHPGTLLAALLAWLDARARGARLLLRLEDLDPERCRPEWRARMRDDLAWLGLDFDATETQSAFAARHEAALDRLAAAGVLYPCACTRTILRAGALPAPDGGNRYANDIVRASSLGVMSGFAEDGTFRPLAPLTREQAVSVVMETAKKILPTSAIANLPQSVYSTPFPDVATTRWSAVKIEQAKQLGLITGYPPLRNT